MRMITRWPEIIKRRFRAQPRKFSWMRPVSLLPAAECGVERRRGAVRRLRGKGEPQAEKAVKKAVGDAHGLWKRYSSRVAMTVCICLASASEMVNSQPAMRNSSSF